MRWIAILFLVILLVSTVAGFGIAGTFEVKESEQPEIPSEGRTGGGQNRVPLNFTPLFDGLCEREWRCEDWGECDNFLKKRTCADANACREPLTKVDRRLCIIPQDGMPEIFDKSPASYLFLILLLIFLILLLIVIILIIRMIREEIRKKKRRGRKKRKKR